MRAILAQVLEDQGYEVTAVDRGEAAVKSARDATFDLIVADIRMDGMSGLEAVAQTKAHQPEIGTIIVSGYATPEETSRARQLEVGGFLKKPFRMKEFLALVRTELADRHRAEQSQVRGLSIREALLWALGALRVVAETSPPPFPPGHLLRAENLAAALCQSLELAPEVTAEVKAASLLALLEEINPLPEGFGSDVSFLPALKTALSHYHDRWDEDPKPPTEARIVALVVAACEEPRADSDPLPTSGELGQRDPGYLDPSLLKVYHELAHTDLEQTVKVASSSESPARNLLSLARTLERVGDGNGAIKAFTEASALAPNRRESVEALLGKARLTPPDESARSALAAAETARRLGPVIAATTALESGLVLYRHRDPRAREVLLEAVTGLERLGFQGHVARAAIPLVRLGQPLPAARWPRVLDAMLDPRYAEETTRSARWLLPETIEALAHGPGADLSNYLPRLVNQFSGSISSALEAGQLSEEARLFLVTSLSKSQGFLAQEIVESLRKDTDPEIRKQADGLAQRVGRRGGPELVRVRAFGLLEVQRGQEPIPNKLWKTQKTKYFFAFLASEWGRYFHEDHIMDHFWPDDREKGKKNIYWATSVTRRCLRVNDDEPELLERQGESLRLNPTVPRWVDTEEFDKAAQAGATAEAAGQAETARSHYRRMAQLYLGPYLEGCYLDWALRRRDSLEKALVDAMCRLSALAGAAGDHREALESANRALEHDTCRQEAHLLAMQSYIGLGQPESAIEQYQHCEALLRKDYHIEPNTELIECYYRARLGLPGASTI